MAVNMEKTKVIHFRSKKTERTMTEFKLGTKKVDIATNYKYLGLTVDEYLDWKTTADILAKSASKALGSMTAKYFQAKGLLFSTYTKIYQNTVLPVLHYASAVWGYKTFPSQENIHHRAMRTFLGVGKKTPIPGLQGEMGWHKLNFHRRRETVRYWLKLYNMNDARLTKKVFIWDYTRCLTGKKSYNQEVKKILEDNELSDCFYGLMVEKPKPVIHALENQLREGEERKFLEEIQTMPKLRKYRDIKLSLETESYVKSNMSRYNRSVLAKFRTGTFPINIELGRYRRLPVIDRKCTHCPDQVEDEYHFLLECPEYSGDRDVMFREFAEKTGEELENLQKEEKFFLLMHIDAAAKPVSKYLQSALYKRNNRQR